MSISSRITSDAHVGTLRRLGRRPAWLSAAALAGAMLTGRGGPGAAPFDRQFIDMMVPHHESAIDAARAAETRAQKAEIKEPARAIIADQQREIAQMRRWCQAWFA